MSHNRQLVKNEATEKQVSQEPKDIIKDPYVLDGEKPLVPAEHEEKPRLLSYKARRKTYKETHDKPSATTP